MSYFLHNTPAAADARISVQEPSNRSLNTTQELENEINVVIHGLNKRAGQLLASYSHPPSADALLPPSKGVELTQDSATEQEAVPGASPTQIVSHDDATPHEDQPATPPSNDIAFEPPRDHKWNTPKALTFTLPALPPIAET